MVGHLLSKVNFGQCHTGAHCPQWWARWADQRPQAHRAGAAAALSLPLLFSFFTSVWREKTSVAISDSPSDFISCCRLTPNLICWFEGTSQWLLQLQDSNQRTLRNVSWIVNQVQDRVKNIKKFRTRKLEWVWTKLLQVLLIFIIQFFYSSSSP